MDNVINYKPVDRREADHQYLNLLVDVLRKGKPFSSIHGSLPENKKFSDGGSLDRTGGELRYDLSNGFPLETLRDLRGGFKGCVNEVVAFLNGARTLDELRSFGVPDAFWAPSLTKEKCEKFGLKEGDMGPGSYGEILRRFPAVGGGTFDQVLAAENMMKKRPNSRTIIWTTWYPPYAMGDKEQGHPRKVVVAPCHGSFIRFKFYENTKEMHMHMTARSSDSPVGLMYNVPQWCAVGMAFAHWAGYKFTQYVVEPIDPQIYNAQIEDVEEMIKRPPRKLPTVILNPKGKREHLWDYRSEDFELLDYDPHPKLRIDALT